MCAILGLPEQKPPTTSPKERHIMTLNNEYSSALRDLFYKETEKNDDRMFARELPYNTPQMNDEDMFKGIPGITEVEKNDEDMFKGISGITEVKKNDESLSSSALLYREPEKNDEDMMKTKGVVETATTDNVPPARDLPRMTAEVLISQIDTYERMRFDDFSLYLCLTPTAGYWAKVMFDGDRPLSYEIYDTLKEAHPAGWDHDASERAEAIDGELMTDI
jgi:hypothetical protein